MTQPASKPAAPQEARTDDLLASGAEAGDGARGFEGQADPQSLQTGMEGIAGATVRQGTPATDSQEPARTETVQDNPGSARNRQGA